MIELELLSKLLTMSRIAIGVRVADMARKMGVGKDTIEKWERAESLPSEKYLPRIAENYKIDLEDLKLTRKKNAEARLNVTRVRNGTAPRRKIDKDNEVHQPCNTGVGLYVAVRMR